ncbi:MAG TPA: phosphate transport system regulatory protein PhoU [Micrococcales bacterium]|uniref:Phosphate-specific transport system accessory protein PhoU n=1 Tax=Miniimonas arenae TaxID=676201 RepID=A0A5C5BES2_9MICO|nr:phosphate signaling complex protein PhoU [Miniimonas arenae]TNU76723.1 phosphate signaling complex protein PhoU [Miniimonas arenae]HCX84979.1 phosphate transport system regulatory protein PhoU [Micrococcales bacterium]
MREIFQQELEQVADDLAAMASLVRTAMQDATTALFTQDLGLAETVIERDRRIDALQDGVDQQCVTLLARQQPVATDLRVVVSAMRMSSTIERMGDLARHIASIARGRFPDPALPPLAEPLFRSIADATNAVASDVVDLLESRDVELAHRVMADDDELDRLHQETFRIILSPSADATAFTPQQIVDITLLGRYFERFGDHGTSVARRILFLVTGETVSSTAGVR